MGLVFMPRQGPALTMPSGNGELFAGGISKFGPLPVPVPVPGVVGLSLGIGSGGGGIKLTSFVLGIGAGLESGIILGVGFIALYLRRKNYLFNKQRRYAGLIAVCLASLPAVIIGWFSTVTLVVWVGISATLLSLALNWLVPVKENQAKQEPLNELNN